jgi:RNA polymerase sigma-70 factor (ECF subfamily)
LLRKFGYTGAYPDEKAWIIPGDGAPDDIVDDDALSERVGSGDARAAEEIVHRYYPKVYRLVHRMSDGSADIAEEMAQNVFLRIFDHIQSFRQEAAFSTWVYRIAVNVCLDDRKRRGRWQKFLIPWAFGRKGVADAKEEWEPPDPRAAADPEKMMKGRQLEAAVRSAMEALTDKQRMIFQLKVFEELRISEIAAIMDMAEGTVKSHLFRATQALRERLKNWIDRE